MTALLCTALAAGLGAALGSAGGPAGRPSEGAPAVPAPVGGGAAARMPADAAAPHRAAGGALAPCRALPRLLRLVYEGKLAPDAGTPPAGVQRARGGAALAPGLRAAGGVPALLPAPAGPLPAAFTHVLVLEYHDVVPDVCAHNADEMPVSAFARQMAELQASGVRVVTARTLAAWLAAGVPLPREVVVLTFDDGYEGVYLYAFPILRRYGLPFSLFIIGADIRARGPAVPSGYARLTFAEIRRMQASGLADFESHTWNLHGNVPCPYDCASAAAIRADLEREARFLHRLTGTWPVAFAYPGGRVSRTGLAEARAFYRVAFIGNRVPPLPLWSRDADWLLPRFPVYARTDLSTLLVAEAHGWRWFRVAPRFVLPVLPRPAPALWVRSLSTARPLGAARPRRA